MSLPQTRVEIAFDLSEVVPDFFTLNDDTRGILTGGTVTSIYPLAGEILQDVSDTARSVSISRGRSRELDKYRVGQATMVLDNRERTYDPTDLATAYLGQIQPRKEVRLTVGNQVAFNGVVEDWSFNYDVGGDSTTTLLAVDGFSLLARQDIGGFSQGTATCDSRISAVLDASGVAFPPAKRDIAASSYVLKSGTVAADTNALAYLQSIETVEAGDFFIAANGLVTFKTRQPGIQDAAYDAAVSYDDSTTDYSYPPPALTSNVVFTDEAPGVVTVGSATEIRVPYVGIGMELGMDQVRNLVNVTFGTATYTSQNTDSQDRYGVVSLQVDGSLFQSSSDAEDLADYLVARYQQPVVRYNEVVVDLGGVDTAQIASLLALDLTDVVRIRFRPNRLNARVERVATVEGIDHQISPQRHRIIYRFSAAPGS